MIEFFNQYPLLLQIAILLSSVIVGAIFRWMSHSIIRRVSRGRGLVYGDIIASSLSFMLFWLSMVFGLYLFFTVVLYPDYVRQVVHSVLWTFVILVIAVAFARTASSLLLRLTEFRGSGNAKSSLLQKFVIFTIYIVAAVLILDAFNIKVTTFIATLGIGGLALALAMQETLTNVLAGTYITLSNQMRVGDTVSFDGNEGMILDIGWRTTLIRKSDESLLVVPNSKFSQAFVTAFPYDSDTLRGRIVLPLSISEDPSRAEGMILEIIQASASDPDQPGISPREGLIAGLRSTPEPLVRIGEFKDGGMELILTFSVLSHSILGSVRTELIKRIHSRFSTEGIRLNSPGSAR